MGNLEIIENTKEARDNSTAGGHGHSEERITIEQLEALKNGKTLMIDVNYEYSMAITLDTFPLPEGYEDYCD